MTKKNFCVGIKKKSLMLRPFLHDTVCQFSKSYDVRMLDATTGEGIATCATDRVTVTEREGRVQLATHSCPWIEQK